MTDLTTVIARLDTIISKLDEVITKISGGTVPDNSDIIAGQNQNTQDIINNQNAGNQAIQDNADKNTETIVEKVEEAKKGIISGIIDGIKGLFLPSDEFFKAYFDDLLAWFSDRFGFLAFPIELLVKFVGMFLGASDVDCVLVLPSFSISGYPLWGDLSFNLTEFLETYFSFVLVAIRTVTSIYLIMSFVQLCERKWDEVMKN